LRAIPSSLKSSPVSVQKPSSPETRQARQS
jgi:hypothetical protein